MYSKNIKEEPLSIKECFDFSLSMFIKNYKIIIILSILFILPVLIFDSLITKHILTTSILQDMLTYGLYSLPDKYLIIILIYSFSTAIINFMLIGGITVIVDKEAGSETVKFSDIIEGSLSKIIGYIILTVIYVLSVSFGIMLFIVPGIYIAIVFNFAPNALAIKNNGVAGAFKESALIVKGRFLQTVAFLIITFLLSFSASSLIKTIIYAILPGILTNDIFSIIVELIIGTLNLYFNFVVSVWFINKYYILHSYLNSMGND